MNIDGIYVAIEKLRSVIKSKTIFDSWETELAALDACRAIEHRTNIIIWIIDDLKSDLKIGASYKDLEKGIQRLIKKIEEAGDYSFGQ